MRMLSTIAVTSENSTMATTWKVVKRSVLATPRQK
jgi:hypothetical protein